MGLIQHLTQKIISLHDDRKQRSMLTSMKTFIAALPELRAEGVGKNAQFPVFSRKAFDYTYKLLPKKLASI